MLSVSRAFLKTIIFNKILINTILYMINIILYMRNYNCFRSIKEYDYILSKIIILFVRYANYIVEEFIYLMCCIEYAVEAG